MKLVDLSDDSKHLICVCVIISMCMVWLSLKPSVFSVRELLGDRITALMVYGLMLVSLVLVLLIGLRDSSTKRMKATNTM